MSERTPPRVFPVDPLVALFESNKEAQTKMGLSGARWKLWLNEGLNLHECDKMAVRFGFHPAELWSDWYAKADWMPPPLSAKTLQTRRRLGLPV